MGSGSQTEKNLPQVLLQVNFLDDNILHCLLWVLSFYGVNFSNIQRRLWIGFWFTYHLSASTTVMLNSQYCSMLTCVKHIQEVWLLRWLLHWYMVVTYPSVSNSETHIPPPHPELRLFLGMTPECFACLAFSHIYTYTHMVPIVT